MEALNSAMTFDNVLYGLKKAPQANAADLKKEKDMAKIEKTAEDFEAFFITKMMESMFEGISTDGMFGGGHAEKNLPLHAFGRIRQSNGQNRKHRR